MKEGKNIRRGDITRVKLNGERQVKRERRIGYGEDGKTGGARSGRKRKKKRPEKK